MQSWLTKTYAMLMTTLPDNAILMIMGVLEALLEPALVVGLVYCIFTR